MLLRLTDLRDEVGAMKAHGCEITGTPQSWPSPAPASGQDPTVSPDRISRPAGAWTSIRALMYYHPLTW
jgi:hypothetical protein